MTELIVQQVLRDSSTGRVDVLATQNAFDRKITEFKFTDEIQRLRALSDRDQGECSCGDLLLELTKVGKCISLPCEKHDWDLVNEVAEGLRGRVRLELGRGMVASRNQDHGADTAICPACAKTVGIEGSRFFAQHGDINGHCAGSGMKV